MRRVAVVTTFVDLWEAFSLCGVVAAQLRALVAHGHDTTFVACDGCVPRGAFADPALGQVRLPVYHLERDADAIERRAEFRDAVERIKARLRPALAAMDVAITHDIVYLPHHLAYNHACRELAHELPRLRWLHWIHSAPEARPDLPDDDPRVARFRAFPRGLLVYPNAADAPRVARQYGVPERDVRVVPHPLDFPAVHDFHPITTALVERFDLYAPDVLTVYPIRMDRGKQPEKLVRLFAELKRAGRTVRLVVAAFHSTGAHFVAYRDEVAREARALGLADDEVVFTNALDALPGLSPDVVRAMAVELPHRVVIDLLRLTNLYVHPSASETYSLVTQEAASCGNLLVLNEDFPPMRDVYGPAALYARFSSTLFTTTFSPSETAYHADLARRILYHLDAERALAQRTRVRQTRNPGAVFRAFLEPLLYAESDGDVAADAPPRAG